MTAIECFACRPIPLADGPEPRALCHAHKAACRVETGELLETVLTWAEPGDAPLEGGPLACVYNPVFVDAADGSVRKGWTDFAMGGMAVFEDRFGARDLIEFRAFEDPTLRPFWRAIAADRTVYVAHTWRTRLRRWFGRPSPRPEAIMRLADHHTIALLQRRVRACRAAAGRTWPRSFSELEEWLGISDDSLLREASAAELDAFAVALAEVAVRTLGAARRSTSNR